MPSPCSIWPPPGSTHRQRPVTLGTETPGAVVYRGEKPSIKVDHRRITVRPGSDEAKRSRVLHRWQNSLLHVAARPLIEKWEKKLNVEVLGYFLHFMKTKWGSSKPPVGHIRLNTEQVKKPKDLPEYMIVHEMAHLIEPTHSERFVAILDEHYPSWREARRNLNQLPLTAEEWQRLSLDSPRIHPDAAKCPHLVPTPPGPEKAKAAELFRIQRLSLVAGVGFEPTTFRL